MDSYRFLILWLAASMILQATCTPTIHAANFTVTKTEDTNDGVCDADCSLREAIVAANAGREVDTINLPTGTYVLTRSGKNEDLSDTGDLDIRGDLILIGENAGTTSIDGSRNDRVLHVVAINIGTLEVPIIYRPTVTISGVTIQHGSIVSFYPDVVGAPCGGGILNEGTLTLSNVIVGGNEASHGGGICNNGGTLGLREDTIIRDNTASGESDISFSRSVGLGGGIINLGFTFRAPFQTQFGTTEITDSTVSGNKAGGMIGSGSALEIIRGSGGGVFNDRGTLRVINSTVNDNTAFGDGGGIFNRSETRVQQGETVTLTRSVVEGNKAGNVLNITPTPLVVQGAGGGIFNDAGQVGLTESTVSDNTAEGNGGGIANRGTFRLVRSTISGNGAANDGGGIHTSTTAHLTNSTISTNEAHRNGGGIANSGGEVTLNNITIADNISDSDSINGGDGGGVFNEVILVEEFESRIGPVSFRNTLIAKNVDNGGQGPDCFGSLISQQFNLVQNATGCSFDRTNNRVGDDPGLGLLADNGGPVAGSEGPPLSHALLDGSPAIDAGNPTGCTDELGALLTTDQRGVGRPPETDEAGVGEVCDIGAYERMLPTADLSITKEDSPDPVVVGNELTYTITVTNNGPSAATGVTVRDILPTDVVPASATSTRGPCSGGCEVNCPLGTVERGGVVTVTIVIKPTRVRAVTNTATVSGMELDPDTANNTTAETTTTVVPPTQLSQASLILRPVADFPDDPRLAYVLIGSSLQLTPADPFALLRPPLGPFGVNLWRLFRFVPDPAELPDRGRYREFSRDDRDDSFFDFVPGRGFWLIARNGGTVTFTGEPPDVSRPFEILLDPGPQQIATPFNFPEEFTIDWVRCVVPSLPEGVNTSLFDFAGTVGGYFMQGAMAPMRGYWVCNETPFPVMLSIAPECVRKFDAAACPVPVRSSAQSPPVPQRANFLSGWRMKLSVAVGTVKDAENYLGVDVAGQDGHDPLDYTDPPPIHGLSLFFPHLEWNGTWPYYATDIRGVSAGVPQVWDFEVEANFRNEEVQLQWDLDGVIGEGLTLRDVEAGQAMNMGQTNVYTYNSGRGGVRHFRVMTE